MMYNLILDDKERPCIIHEVPAFAVESTDRMCSTAELLCFI